MKKLFVFQKGSSPKYQTELESAYKLCKDGEQLERIDFQQFDVDCLESVDVVVSNRLPYRAQVMLRGLKIVSVIFGSQDNKDDYSDLCIDHLYDGKDKYFSGKEFSLHDVACRSEDMMNIFELIRQGKLSSREIAEKVSNPKDNLTISHNQINRMKKLIEIGWYN